MLSLSKVSFTGLIGVGDIEVDLRPNQNVYVFIGENGVGKTKFLEGLFQALGATSETLVGKKLIPLSEGVAPAMKWIFEKVECIGRPKIKFNARGDWESEINVRQSWHKKICIYSGAHNRGHIFNQKNSGEAHQYPLSVARAKRDYIRYILNSINDGNFAQLGMDNDIENWFITRAQSVNPYQSSGNKGQQEINQILSVLNLIDANIDANFLNIDDDNHIYIKVRGEIRNITQLSTGYTAILKIIQFIFSGFGALSEFTSLEQWDGVVIIDEIESHLHVSWQTRIIPLLKKIFPKNTFFIATHSALVLSQLNEGEAYRLERDGDGVVRAKCIPNPSVSTMADLLDESFQINLNTLKRENANAQSQASAKEALLALMDKIEIKESHRE